MKTYWPNIGLANASFGQGFAVSQIQVLKAFNIIANNGNMINPSIVITEKEKKTTNIFRPETIDTMKEILKYAVENGNMNKYRPTSLEVCAKSGTAQIVTNGTYDESQTIASYIGFTPCKNPKFTMIVTYVRPRTSPWGEGTAGPIWYDIAKFADRLIN
jgi:cell division protein FtsI/penicillin-binding protein 2